MKRSEINEAIRQATAAFARHGQALPPNPAWDVTDFALADFKRYGLTAVNLASQPEYCEKVMFSQKHQQTPAHYHGRKKEDIICRWGILAVQIFTDGAPVRLEVNGLERDFENRQIVKLSAGERITLVPGVAHAFWAESCYAIIGEVSTANDDANDNFFTDPAIGRFTAVIEDEPALVRLVSD